jgi:exonuclease III
MTENNIKTKQIKICTWNVCLGIFHKLQFVKTAIEENDIDILCIQEAEVKVEDNVNLLQIQGFSLEIEKTSTTFSRRTIMYIKNHISYERMSHLEKEDAHVICVKLQKYNICLASVYRTYKLTHKASHKEAIEEQIGILGALLDTGADTLIVGDFNLDYRKRNDVSYHLRHLYEEWITFEQEHQLLQMVDFATWQRTNGNQIISSILDHVYTNNISLIESVEEAGYVVGDHCPVITTLTRRSRSLTSTKTVRDWKKYSPELLLTELGKQSWEIELESVQDFNDELEQRLMTVVDKLVPFVQKKIKRGQFSESPTITNLKRKKKNILTNAKRRNSAQLLKRSQDLGKEIRKKILSSKKAQIREKILNGGQSGLWKGLNLALDKETEQIPNEIRWANRTITNSSEKAQAFADFFSTKIRNIVEQNNVQDEPTNGGKVVNVQEANYVTLQKTQDIMKNLKQKNCYGCDRIPLRILKDGYEILGKPVFKLMNKIYEQEEIPEQWKMSRVIPLHKKGPKSKIENYRPISNLCAVSKVFEKLMLQRILETADGDTLFTPHQHGFRKGRSTVTAIAELQRIIATNMDMDEYVAVASLDLSAAFDVVNVNLLIERLNTMGMPGDLVRVLSSWLTDRAAYVEVDGECSEYYLVQEGTVQGSVLGPVLFNLFIRPLLETATSPAYADDSYYYGTSKVKLRALEILQENLKAAIKWITNSGLKVNLEKTEICIFHRTDTSKATITVGNVRVESTHHMGCLGVILDNRLTWDRQVDKVIVDSRRSLQAVKLVRRYFNEEETAKLVTSLVYSRLYYASEAWLLPTLKERQFNKLHSQS